MEKGLLCASVDSHIIYIEVGFVFGEEAKWKEEGKFSVDIFAFGT